MRKAQENGSMKRKGIPLPTFFVTKLIGVTYISSLKINKYT